MSVFLLLLALVGPACGEDTSFRAEGREPPGFASVEAPGPVDESEVFGRPLAEAPGEERLSEDDAAPSPASTDMEAHATEIPGGELLAAAAPTITVEGVTNGATLSYDLVLLRGTVSPGTSSISFTVAGRTANFPVVSGRWKAFGLLRQGVNDIILAAGGATRTLRITYSPPTNRRFVRFIYLLGSDGDGTFQAPTGEPNTQASALARIRTGARLMQVLTAETMAKHGFGRRTFRVERDPAGEPVVTVFRSSKTTAELRALTGNDAADDDAVYRHLYGELAGLPNRENSIDVVILSMTRRDPATGRAAAHMALGGGRLAIYSSANLHTWAPSLAELSARFSDTRVIDTSRLINDSNGRRTHWANFATGIGATLHELGHCLSLPHPSNQQGIMWRGFDHTNRLVMLVEPADAANPGLSPIPPDKEPTWDRSSAVRLRYHRYLAGADIAYAVNTPPSLELASGTLRISSSAGIRHVGYHTPWDVAAHEEFLGAAPNPFGVTLDQLRATLPNATNVRVSAIDGDGNIGERELTLR